MCLDATPNSRGITNIVELPSRAEREEIFRGINPTEELLEEVLLMLPEDWLTDEQFVDIMGGLGCLGGNFSKSAPLKISTKLFLADVKNCSSCRR